MLKRIKEKINSVGRRNVSHKAGFSLIEVIAVTIIIGVMATMLMPAIDGAGSKARNAKLRNDLATLDQAIATYKLEQGSVPASLDSLVPDYVAQNKGFKDAGHRTGAGCLHQMRAKETASLVEYTGRRNNM